MASTMVMMCNILGIDRINMDSKVILIKEQHGSNASFLMNAILMHALKRMDAVCFVLCHNTFGHYHNIGMRLGYNLLALKEKGQVTVAEPMKIIASNITDICRNSTDKKKMIIPDATSTEHIHIMHKLFTCVREKYNEAAKFNESVVLIIDDINHLFDFGFDTRDVMYFVRYLRSCIALHPLSQLCILMHIYQGNSQISNVNVVTNALKHMAHLCIMTQPFKTGYSNDASGKLTIHWKMDFIKLKYHWAEKTTHLFKLLDWQIKIFAPGAMSVLS